MALRGGAHLEDPQIRERDAPSACIEARPEQHELPRAITLVPSESTQLKLIFGISCRFIWIAS